MSFFVYIMASGPYGTLYIGSTDNLAKRVEDHQQKVRPRSFTAKYGVDKLVWFEAFELRENAFRRERQMKEWRRKWKIQLIEELNPAWADLSEDLTTCSCSAKAGGRPFSLDPGFRRDERVYLRASYVQTRSPALGGRRS
jgi:putative endonuclease